MKEAKGRVALLSPEKQALLQRFLRQKAAEAAAPDGIRRREADGPSPLSFAQRRLWFLDQLEPGSTAYNMPYALRLRGDLDEAALERSLAEVVRRHESLRTVFSAGPDGEPVQVVEPAGAFALERLDLSALPRDEADAEARRIAAEEAETPFDLAAGPLCRARLARLGEGEWALYLTLHHIVSDGWSTGVLIREVDALYDAFRRGEPSPLPELEIQYADFAVWQHEHLSEEVVDRQLDYWRNQLAGAPSVLEIPTDRPRPSVPGGVGASRDFALSAETSRGLRELADREGATLFATLLAAFQVLLSRWSGQDDVSVGTPVAGRTRLELEPLIGFFVNTLVVRADLSGDPSFREVVGRVRGTVVEAQANQDVPFERLVEEIAPDRTLAYTPLFQAIFSLRNAGRDGIRLGGLDVQPLDGGAASAKFDLSLSVDEEEDGTLAGSLAFREDLFDGDTAERMLAAFATMLDAAASAPDLRLSELPLLDASELRRLLVEWNAADVPVPAPTVHRQFELQAAETPDRVAVVFGDEVLTYAELDRRANRLAHHLLALGAGGEKVGICLERGLALPVALLGILKAGGAYVPLDPAFPAERIGFVLRDAAVRVVLTQASLEADVLAHGVRALCLDREAAEVDARSDLPPEVEVGADDLAYVIFTSGSTGEPKGSEIPHRAIPGFFRGVDYVRFDRDQVLLHYASPSWDVLTLEFWPAVLTGAKCVLHPLRSPEPRELEPLVREHGVTTLWLSSAYFNTLVDTVPEALRGVRQVMVGGEAVSPPHVRRVMERFPGMRVVNGYGPSECTVFTACHVVPEGFAGASIPIGRPIGDRRVYVVDAAFNPVPVGVAGELCVGGPAVARGYLNRPALTAEKFVPDPFSAEPGARLYRSGDRVRWRADGTLEFLGRVDHQVKIRGFRIEPGEVEAALLANPAVRDAVALAREDAPGDRRLVAYVALAPGEAVSGGDLREALAAHLPAYMVPSAVVVLERIPLTANGKVDRRALPAPDAQAATAGLVAPRTPTEEVLAGIWGAVLGAERVGVHDDFFALGGHSLLATRAVSRVRQAFSVDVPLRLLFESPTVAGFAERLDALLREDRGAQAPPLVPAGREGPLPLSFAQERLWFIHQMDPDGAAYNMPFPARVRGALDARALRRALSELVRRHESLRTVFTEREGTVAQEVRAPSPVPLPMADLAGLPAHAAEKELRRLAAADALRPFDLARGPLLRTSLARLADGEWAVLFCMHHVVSDGWSMGVLVDELSALYAAFAEGREPVLPELPVQYADYAVWQRDWLSGEVLEGQVAWWRERLAGAPPRIELPFDRPRGPALRAPARSVPVAVPADAARVLRALSREEGSTLFMTVLAAFQLLLSRYAGEEDVSVGTPIAGRTRVETEGLIGFFINTLVLRADLSGNPTFRGLLSRVRETTLGAYAHQELPFERLVDALQPERSPGHSPLFQVLFSLDPAGAKQEAEPRLGALSLEPLDAGNLPSKFDLSATLAEDEDGIRGVLSYPPELFDAATVEHMAEHFRRLLGAVAAEPDAPLGRFSLLGPEEERQVLAGFNATDVRFAEADTPLHRLFEAQAARTPDATALTFEGESLTYAALDAWTNRLARRLRALGVGPETRVGVCLERSPEMVAALLGVLKAGGAYVPIDPEYPADRVAYMLEDSAAPVLLTLERHRDGLPAHAGAVLCLDGDRAEVEREDDAPLEGAAGADHLAYVIYTSGSTGRPKGAMNAHRGIVNRLLWMQAEYGLDASDVVLQKTPFGFDVSVWEFFWPLIAGSRLVLARPGGHRDPAYLTELIGSEGITTLHFVPPMLQVFLEAGDPSRCGTLRRIVCSGEALPPELAERAWEVIPGAGLHNLYGPTEAAVDVTYWACEPRERRVVPIGRPVANTRVYVLDPWLNPSPVGVPGELFIGGVQVGRGYLGRPELTAKTFVPDPFSEVPGARLYRTGDRTRWLPEGEVEYLGRIDFQVKVRGFRIEPGEIEAALLAQPGVREAMVVAREDRPGIRQLVAYVVADEAAGAVDAAALRAGLAARLPEHMVPAAFVRLEGFPLTPHGKVDRRALPAPDGALLDAAEYVAPRDPVEAALARAWAETLGVERVGIHDNYFALGGDSIRSIRVLAKLRERGIAYSLPDLFRYQTVAELAPRVRLESRAGGARSEPFSLLSTEERARLPEGVEDAYPLTQLQLGMVYHSEENPEKPLYVNVSTYHVVAAYDEARLRRALASLARRHPILRTSFDLGGFSEPLQLVFREVEIPLEVADLSGLPPEAQDAAVDAWIEAEHRRPFAWGSAPLIRFHAHPRGPGAFQLGVTEHHAILDGWSAAALLSELFETYLAEGEPAAAPPPATPFREYVALEREALAAPAAREFWADLLDGAVPSVPPSLGGGAVPDKRSRMEDVPEATLEALGRLARRAGVPLKSVFLAAHLRALSALSGTDDVLTGIVSNGRPEGEDGEQILGLFLNIVPLRHRLAGGSWLDLVRDAFEVEGRILPFRRFPVAEMQRMRGGGDLVEVLFNFVHFHVLDRLVEEEGERFLQAHTSGRTNFPIAVSFLVGTGGESASLIVEYDAARFSPAQLDDLFRTYLDVLKRVVADPAARYDGADLLSEEERRRVLETWNDTTRGFPLEEPVHRLFERAAERSPDALAVTSAAGTLTYGEMECAANRLAHALRARGAGPESRVGICLERGLDLPVAQLAVLKAGGAYVPLDPAYPSERIGYALEDSGARWVLTSSSLAGRIPAGAADPICLDAERDALARMPDTAPTGDVAPDGAAYVIYTSGSTGKPKGVVVPHAPLSNLAHWHREAFGVGEADRATQVAGLGFDASVWEVWPYLTCGASLQLVEDEEVRTSPEGLRTFLVDREVTVAFVPTPLTEGLLGLEWPAETRLRVLLTGGDALRGRPGAGLPFTLVNNYGPTEATVVATSGVVAPASEEAGDVRAPSIGGPIANARSYVLDRALHPVPVGVPGELYVGGAGVARGYEERPDLTAEHFVPDPFGGVAGARLYRTGDRVRWLGTGELEFLGRTDFQVKVRGFRIELGEVEAVLGRHPSVREVVVLVREDEPGVRRIVAYVVAAGEDGVEPAALRAFAGSELPEYMVPSAVVVLEALPVTANGKVDRAALPAPEGGEEERAYVAPRTPVEEIVAGIWAEVLERERVGVHDDFFYLGGHSLVATRVVSRVRAALGVELPLRALFEAPTVAGLTARVDAELRAGGGEQGPPLVPVPREGALPLSFAQQRLWFIDQLRPGSPAYNIPFALRVRGALDVAALSGALAEVVRRHEVLRTVFAAPEGEPVQVIRDDAPPVLAAMDLRDLPLGEREDTLLRLVGEEAVRPFDLAAGPLLRGSLVRLDDEEWALLFTLHHIAGDAWSTGVLVDEVSELYAAAVEGREARLPELPVQYADFAVWQRNRLSGEALEAQLDWWRGRLGGAPPLLDLPTDLPRPQVQGSRGENVVLELPAELSAALRALSRREAATPFMTLLAAWQHLLGRHAGQDDVSVGTPIAGRTRLETEGLIGFFVNTLVLRADLSGDPTFRELLHRVKEGTLGAYAHQEVPFERLVEDLAPERSFAHTPLFQAMFALQGAETGELGLGGLELEGIRIPETSVKFDLMLTLSDDGERFGGLLSYRAELWEPGTMERLVERYARALAQVAKDPDAPLGRFSLLGLEEERQVLADFNATDVRFAGADTPLHRLFEAQAARTPDATALTFEGESVTYADLDAWTNRLARRLRALGVGPETRVGVCLERSPEMVAALLGVLKSGGAYVPIDPEYPADRVAYMLEDSAAPVLLTLERHRDGLPAHGGAVLCLDGDRAEVEREDGAPLEGGAGADHLAYVIYTSGSTGRPKGAMNAHRGIVNRLLWMQAEYGLDASDVVLQKTPFGFDVSVWEFFWPLIAGSRLVLARPGGHRDPAYLTELIGSEGITTLHFVPPMLQVFLEAGDPARCGTLRRIVCSGEALPPELAERAQEVLPGAGLHNLYGPTEAAVDVTYWACVPRERRVVPIGRPVANTRVYVLDPWLNPSPVGVPGELYIGGVQVGRGYLGRPELTAKTFVPDPFSGVPGARLYRTGDRTRWLPEGEVEYLGRIDFQVKVRGFRIEPGEIEAALLAQPGVREAMVVAREDRPGIRQLVAYLVADEMDVDVDAVALRAGLAARLPEHMVPAAFVRLEGFPLTPHGKVDRRALPAPEHTAPAEYVAPRTTTEVTLAAVWSEVLGVERVGAGDGFFELGGHSLLATRVVSRLRASFQAEVPVHALFEHTTVAALAQYIDEAEQARLEDLAGGLEGLDEDELAALLAEMEDA